MWSAGLAYRGVRDARALQLRPERGVDRARALEPLHLLEGADALDEVLAERGRERGDDVVQRGELLGEVGHRRARSSRAQRLGGRSVAVSSRLTGSKPGARHGRQPDLERFRSRVCRARRLRRRRSSGRSRPRRRGSPGPGRGRPPLARASRRAAAARLRPGCRRASREASAGSGPSPSFDRADSQATWNGPGLASFDLEEETPVAADAGGGHCRGAAHQAHARARCGRG